VLGLQLQTMNVSGRPSDRLPPALSVEGPLPPLGAQLLVIDPATQRAIKRWYM
jgi:hypothetical protein